MPLNEKGKKIMKSMKEQYGSKKGTNIFYASLNKKKIKGVEKKLAGGLLLKGVKAAVRSEPYKRFSKKTVDTVKKFYKEGKERLASTETNKTILKGLKDERFMRGLQNLDIKRAKTAELLKMTQFVKKEAMKEGKKPIVRLMRKSRRGLADYGRSLGQKAKAMMQARVSKTRMN